MPLVVGDRGAQFRDDRAGRGLVALPLLQGADGGLSDLFRAVRVREALAQVIAPVTVAGADISAKIVVPSQPSHRFSSGLAFISPQFSRGCLSASGDHPGSLPVSRSALLFRLGCRFPKDAGLR